MKFLRSFFCIFIVDIQRSKLNFRNNLFKKIFFMHLLVLTIFGKYYIRHILSGHRKIVTIFQQHQLQVLKYFGNLTIFPRNIFIYNTARNCTHPRKHVDCPHSIVILKEYFENIPLKSCNIAKVFMKLLERFLKCPFKTS